jgi:hypothetical protein
MLADNMCLYCGKKITKEQMAKSKRGDHEKCYATVRRRIKDRRYTESEAINLGLIAPIKQSGRPPQLNEIEARIEEKNKTS